MVPGKTQQIRRRHPSGVSRLLPPWFSGQEAGVQANLRRHRSGQCR